jgi:hypothetical protein
MKMAQAKFCEFCGEPLLTGDTFCGSCGRKLPGEQAGSGLKFVVVDGQSLGQVIQLHPGDYTLGRGAQADLKLDDLAVSRQHAQLTVQSGGVTVKDLNTANGTLVNGAPLLGVRRIKPGDRIRVGETVLELQREREQPVRSAVNAQAKQGLKSSTAPKARTPKRSRVLPLAIGIFAVLVCVITAVVLAGDSAITAWFDASSAGASDGTVAVQLVNQASIDVCFVHISPSSDDQWGEDWLGSQETIPPGGTRSFSLQPDLVFDWVALNCQQEVMGEGYRLVAGPGLQLNVGP